MFIAFIQSILLVNSCLIQNCEFCSPSFPDTCLNCNPGYTRDLELGCSPSQFHESSFYHIENCLELKDSSCTQCLEGYSLAFGRCEPICSSSDCLCFYPDTCLHIKRSLCDSSKCDTCDIINENCKVCKGGFGLNELKECVECIDPNCANCNTNFNICEKCTAGTILEGLNCTYCGTMNCGSCSESTKKCIYCAKGMNFDSQGYCCDSSCLTCSYNQQTCSSCKKNAFLDKICYDCIENCQFCINNSSCYECEEGYEQNYKGDCVEKGCKVKNCLNCLNQDKICLKCIEDYVLDHLNHCCFHDCKTCNADSPNCVTCYDGMYLDEIKCKSCSDHCLTCSNFGNCLSCANGYEIVSGYCNKIKTKESPFKLPAIFSVVSIFVIGSISVFVWLILDKKKIRIPVERVVVKPKHEHPRENNRGIEPIDAFEMVGLYNIQQINDSYSHAKNSKRNSARQNHPRNSQEKINPNSKTPIYVSVPQSEPVEFIPSNPPLNPTINNTDNLQQKSELPDISKPIYEHESISICNFESIVPVVHLDEVKSYNGIEVCFTCQERLDGNDEVRALPCGHPYHGKCIYNMMIYQNRKQCLSCLRSYF
ncbi:hypothetical protein SteCoe_20993 [Stentor coeruleus]|uniref:RING-type domain-containing protein n=1 Tax=Stentor coeruleus TaxID=5963 RepID=A0A1R2BQJ5_9CILI|nr:hypothetical protein SteCoe_20993 [Stentor coeruleus]